MSLFFYSVSDMNTKFTLQLLRTQSSQSLALCMTGTNTFSSLLAQRGISAPAFQNLINYIVLNAIYTTYTLYRYGFKKWWSMVVKDGWKCT